MWQTGLSNSLVCPGQLSQHRAVCERGRALSRGRERPCSRSRPLFAPIWNGEKVLWDGFRAWCRRRPSLTAALQTLMSYIHVRLVTEQLMITQSRRTVVLPLLECVKIPGIWWVCFFWMIAWRCYSYSLFAFLAFCEHKRKKQTRFICPALRADILSVIFCDFELGQLSSPVVLFLEQREQQPVGRTTPPWC